MWEWLQRFLHSSTFKYMMIGIGLLLLTLMIAYYLICFYIARQAENKLNEGQKLYQPKKTNNMIKEKEAFFKSLSQNERLTALRENADLNYSKNVIRPFSDEELTEMKHTLSEVDIQMNDAEIEKKELTKEVNDRIKVFKDKRVYLLKSLKDKYLEQLETVFDIADQENGVMDTFDCEGNLLSTRKLTPKETFMLQ
jgi:hypothetical protein